MMTLRTVIIICSVAAGVFFVVFDFICLYNTMWRPFAFLELAVVVALLVVWFLYRFDWHIWNFFEWMTRPPTKPPDFSCVRCQSIRVIVHECTEKGFLRRRCWCKDCGYEWSNVEAIPEEPDSTEPHAELK